MPGTHNNKYEPSEECLLLIYIRLLWCFYTLQFQMPLISLWRFSFLFSFFFPTYMWFYVLFSFFFCFVLAIDQNDWLTKRINERADGMEWHVTTWSFLNSIKVQVEKAKWRKSFKHVSMYVRKSMYENSSERINVVLYAEISWKYFVFLQWHLRFLLNMVRFITWKGRLADCGRFFFPFLFNFFFLLLLL